MQAQLQYVFSTPLLLQRNAAAVNQRKVLASWPNRLTLVIYLQARVNVFIGKKAVKGCDPFLTTCDTSSFLLLQKKIKNTGHIPNIVSSFSLISALCKTILLGLFFGLQTICLTPLL